VLKRQYINETGEMCAVHDSNMKGEDKDAAKPLHNFLGNTCQHDLTGTGLWGGPLLAHSSVWFSLKLHKKINN
jgi:hypothetical protein